jgi:ribosomal protein L13E
LRFDVFRQSDTALTVTHLERNRNAGWTASELERPGIEPGAAQSIGLAVDTIETPQPRPNHAKNGIPQGCRPLLPIFCSGL